jgi:hypothetical protein
MFSRGWLRLREGTRIVRVTPRGAQELQALLGISPDALGAASAP